MTDPCHPGIFLHFRSAAVFAEAYSKLTNVKWKGGGIFSVSNSLRVLDLSSYTFQIIVSEESIW